MKFTDVISIAVSYMRQRKVRASLNVLGIIVGIAAITALVSLTQGMSVAVNEQMELLGPRTVVVMGAGGPFVSGGTELRLRDIDRIERIPDVDIATPALSRGATVKARGTSLTATVMGVVPGEFERVFSQVEMELEGGRWLQRGDRTAVVLGANIAHPPGLDEPLVRVGGPITLSIFVEGEERVQTFRVAGIAEEVGTVGFVSIDNVIFLDIRTAQQTFRTSSVDQVYVQAANIDDVDSVVEGIQDEFGEGVMAISAAFLRETVGSIVGLIQLVLGGVAGISLVVAGIAIINTMAISVMERTREIGIMKALGATDASVLLVFLFEAVLTGFIGGAIGVVAGFLLGYVVAAFASFGFVGMSITPVPTLELAMLGLGFAMVTGAVAGLYPARRAAKLDPVEALRYE